MTHNLCIVLDQTSHPGNIGAAARAMRTMGIQALRLVNPKRFPHADATAQASGALDVLEQAQIFDDVASAMADVQVVFGTSARVRDFPWPVVTPRIAAAKIASEYKHSRVAILFGTERYGLSNQALECCHYLIQIPTASDFSSLNLAQAVQVICYEIYQHMQLTERTGSETTQLELPNMAAMDAFYAHLQSVLEQIEFLNPAAPRLLMRRLKRLCHRAQLEHSELQILRGMLTAISRAVHGAPPLKKGEGLGLSSEGILKDYE